MHKSAKSCHQSDALSNYIAGGVSFRRFFSKNASDSKGFVWPDKSQQIGVSFILAGDRLKPRRATFLHAQPFK
jgi:hypothetical protein